MNELIRQLRFDALTRLGSFGGITFFEPKKAFFDHLRELPAVQFVDAGCGMGHVTRQARALGFDMVGLDPVHRVGQYEQVLPLDATIFDYSPECWPVICRPDHSGWCADAIERALQRGASALYVGLEKNVEDDTYGFYGKHSACWPDMGNDGESMWLFEPGRAP